MSITIFRSQFVTTTPPTPPPPPEVLIFHSTRSDVRKKITQGIPRTLRLIRLFYAPLKPGNNTEEHIRTTLLWAALQYCYNHFA